MGKQETVGSKVDGHAETGKSRNRVQLDFSDTACKRLEEMRVKADGASNADLVRNALRLFEWYLDQKAGGKRILTEDSADRIVEVEFIF